MQLDEITVSSLVFTLSEYTTWCVHSDFRYRFLVFIHQICNGNICSSQCELYLKNSIECPFFDNDCWIYRRYSKGLDNRAPTVSPKTKKKTRIEAARPWSSGRSNIFGPNIMTIFPIQPFDIESRAMSIMKTASDSKYT